MPETAQTTKTEWLESFMEEARSIPDNELFSPRGEPGHEEEVIGKITDKSLRQLFEAAIRADAKTYMVKAELVSATSEQDEEMARKKFELATEKMRILFHLFWLGVQSSVATAPPGYMLAIRSNWQVVSTPQRGSNHPIELLGAIGL